MASLPLPLSLMPKGVEHAEVVEEGGFFGGCRYP